MTRPNPPSRHRPHRRPHRIAAHTEPSRGHRPVGDGRPLHLIFDADDTLWDSNIHFLQAEAHFVAELLAAGVGAMEAVNATLRQRELEIIKSHGYGREPFVVVMRMVAAELAPKRARQALSAAVERIVAQFLERECALLPGVEATLVELAARHHLTLFTKGQPREQLRTLARSGLRRHSATSKCPPRRTKPHTGGWW